MKTKRKPVSITMYAPLVGNHLWPAYLSKRRASVLDDLRLNDVTPAYGYHPRVIKVAITEIVPKKRKVQP